MELLVKHFIEHSNTALFRVSDFSAFSFRCFAALYGFLRYKVSTNYSQTRLYPLVFPSITIVCFVQL
jgi:hypothetical protein